MVDLKGFYTLVENNVYARPTSNPLVKQVLVLEKFRFPNPAQFERYLDDVVEEMMSGRPDQKINSLTNPLEMHAWGKIRVCIALLPLLDEDLEQIKADFATYSPFFGQLRLRATCGLLEGGIGRIAVHEDWGMYLAALHDSERQAKGLGYRLHFDMHVKEDSKEHPLPNILFLKPGELIVGNDRQVTESEALEVYGIISELTFDSVRSLPDKSSYETAVYLSMLFSKHLQSRKVINHGDVMDAIKSQRFH